MKRLAIVISLCALVLFAIPSAAWSLPGDTGDLATCVPNVPTAAEAAEAAAYEAWAARTLSNGGSTLYPTYVAAPSAYLSTQYCPQEKSYWCGPAAVQTALTAFGLKPSQGTIAAKLGTTTGGTAMSRVDDVLRAYTGRSYVYHNTPTASDFYGHVQYAVKTCARPMIVDVTIRPGWGPYQYAHSGHIICVDGFSWRYSTIRVNDSYDEHRAMGGGYTAGHVTYGALCLFTGVDRHAYNPIVY